MLTGGERRLDRAVLERQLRAESAQARASFEAGATRLGLPHTFQVARGDVSAELARRAAEAEALVVSLAREARRAELWLGTALRKLLAAPLPRVLLAREGWLSGRSIAVLVDAPHGAGLALEAAARIAAQSASPTSVLLAGAAARSYEEDPAELKRELESRGLASSTILSVGEGGLSSVARAARACSARLIVLPAAGPEIDTPLIEGLLRRLSSALLLVQR
jgi:hypothetical protein